MLSLLMWSLGIIDWSDPQFDDEDESHDQAVHMANNGKYQANENATSKYRTTVQIA